MVVLYWHRTHALAKDHVLILSQFVALSVKSPGQSGPFLSTPYCILESTSFLAVSAYRTPLLGLVALLLYGYLSAELTIFISYLVNRCVSSLLSYTVYKTRFRNKLSKLNNPLVNGVGFLVLN